MSNGHKCVVGTHARRRIRERLCVPQKKVQSYVDKAYDLGIKHKDTEDELQKYFDMLYLKYKKANNIRIYKNTVFIFAGKFLITVLILPQELIEYIKERKLK